MVAPAFFYLPKASYGLALHYDQIHKCFNIHTHTHTHAYTYGGTNQTQSQFPLCFLIYRSIYHHLQSNYSPLTLLVKHTRVILISLCVLN